MSTAHSQHVPTMSCLQALTRTLSAGSHAWAGRHGQCQQPPPQGWPVPPWQPPSAMTPCPQQGQPPAACPQAHGHCHPWLAPLPASLEPVKSSWQLVGLWPTVPHHCPQPCLGRQTGAGQEGTDSRAPWEGTTRCQEKEAYPAPFSRAHVLPRLWDRGMGGSHGATAPAPGPGQRSLSSHGIAEPAVTC